ncbi:MAG: hypothetical protein WCP92_09460 [bacterium]
MLACNNAAATKPVVLHVPLFKRVVVVHDNVGFVASRQDIILIPVVIIPQ